LCEKGFPSVFLKGLSPVSPWGWGSSGSATRARGLSWLVGCPRPSAQTAESSASAQPQLVRSGGGLFACFFFVVKGQTKQGNLVWGRVRNQM